MPQYTTAQAAKRLGLSREQVEDAIVRILMAHPGLPGIDGMISLTGKRDMSTVRVAERVLRYIRTVATGPVPG
ncbi:MAG TPA: hypothetical protein VKG85_01425 [Actinomycetes bacterium]|nr:hypothetical protein [Actinomycetes bacterium]